MGKLPYVAVISALALVAVTPFAPAGQAAAGGCDAGSSRGGDWPLQGHDVSNTHDQPAEHSIGTEQARALHPVWTFYDGHPSGTLAGGLGDINNIATEAYGCVFVGAAHGDGGGRVFALDAATGKVVWQTVLPVATAGLAGAIVGSPTVAGSKVVVIVNQLADGRTKGPYVAALDVHTGRVIWRSAPYTTATNNYSNATPGIYRNIVIAGWSGKEGYPTSHGGIGLVDLRSGKVLAAIDTIPRTDWYYAGGKPKYAGGGVWNTPAIDTSTGYAYIGDANPYSKQIESPRTNAILKVDVDRNRRTFGTVVATAKGEIDQYDQAVYNLSRPTCAVLPDDVFRELPVGPFQNVASDSLGCAQLDLGFGASPNLFRDARGRLVVGELQKSGVYHAVAAATMKPLWKDALGLPCEVCNGSSTAYDAKHHLIVADESPGSFATALRDTGGTPIWRSFEADPIHYNPMSIADGVAYTVDFYGDLRAWNERTGEALLDRPLSVDAGPYAAAYGSSGVSIARHTVFVSTGSYVVAYRPSLP